MSRSVTVPYEPDFDRFKKHKSGYYHGASLKALTKLGKEKGYSLICSDSNRVNAFFNRNGLFEDTGIHNQQVKNAFYPQNKRLLKRSGPLKLPVRLWREQLVSVNSACRPSFVRSRLA